MDGQIVRFTVVWVRITWLRLNIGYSTGLRGLKPKTKPIILPLKGQFMSFQNFTVDFAESAASLPKCTLHRAPFYMRPIYNKYPLTGMFMKFQKVYRSYLLVRGYLLCRSYVKCPLGCFIYFKLRFSRRRHQPYTIGCNILWNFENLVDCSQFLQNFICGWKYSNFSLM